MLFSQGNGGIMIVTGFEKLSLVDYPGNICTTVFTTGCNMRCPFCHNKDLVLGINPDNKLDDFYMHLEKRKNVLDAVCITGGEPSLQKDLLQFIDSIKLYGLKIKLDTNGLDPELLEIIIRDKLVDYIAMDIKNSPSKYNQTSGLDLALPVVDKINKSIVLLKEGTIPYEFRTTVVSELHTDEDFESIATWLEGASAYYLQPYRCSENQLSSETFSFPSSDKLSQYRNILLQKIQKVEIR